MEKDTKIADDEKEMDFVGHLSELRNRLIVTAILFVILFIVGFIYVEEIYAFFVKDLEFKLTAIGPSEIIWIYFSMAGLIAIVGSIPVLTYQIWAFVKPGLTEREQRASLAYIPATFILFIVGLVFGYLMFTKSLIPFLLSLNNGMFEIMFTVDKYFKFLMQVTVPIAILFELPIVVMFLTSIGILTPKFLEKNRRYAYFALVVISTIITPAPDFILPVIISIPLIFIYEISIRLAKRIYNKKLKKHEEIMSEENL
ncbi:twin-arginine translocase subunit TatC [Oceanobacillus chungangensis]|uniref:Sec-independent protein translocase protein TatC n=1 Tax=Oceanobacillus chungangensis TaxID=1229152 RepID=A0A3D8Q1H9_9BACI|nr:twin-arginine translocase subunit TatC [Oceanobacillus chungangensis]RDW22083.1 twin-arginine translocase subunit TatC [Oceanobacillus chungangensis]